ncbi:unnamed protein product, partial [Darwinula stevensoni]
SPITSPVNPVELPSIADQGGARLAFDAVTFHYPSRPDQPALKDINFVVEPGQTVAIVGPSGAGKTTLFQLILRLYDTQEGQIFLQGIPLKSLDLNRLRENMTIVPQEPVIFSTNALENIRYGRPSATEAEVFAAAKAANAHEFIEKLPEGYQTFLGERGVRLSGGQRQRIVIARAILKNPPLLLLDEATSALDSESERLVQEALDSAMRNRTTLNMMEIHTIQAAIDALQNKKISAVELAQVFLARMTSPRGQNLNAFLAINEEVTLNQAKSADLRLSQGLAPLLTGVPIAHKDVFVTQDWPTTAASKILQDYQSPFDATVVENAQAAGVVCLGKTNMDEFAMGSTNENSAFGPSLNPWNTQKVSGGSSGGSASCVAAGLALAATGTDTGGSIRQPASLCGITGLKPTYGLVSRYGMIAYASSLDQAGPMARTAQDCGILLNALAGHDNKDATSIAHAKEDYTRYLSQPWQTDNPVQMPLKGLRVGVPKEFFGEGLDAGVQQVIENALQNIQALGASCVSVSLPKTELSIPVYYVLAPAEASSNLSRYDGVRYGFRADIGPKGNLNDLYTQTRSQGFGEEVKRRILTGTYVLSHGYYDAYYLQAQKIRRIIAEDFQRAFEVCDVLMGPVSPTVAWGLGEKTSDPISMYLADIYTLSVNLAGLPAMSVPCGFSQDLPVGLQLIGNYFSESRLLQVAHTYQQHSNWHLQQAMAW